MTRSKAKEVESEDHRDGGDYKPTSAERALADAFLERCDNRPPAPRIKVSRQQDDRVHLEPDHPDPAFWALAFRAALGTTNGDLARVLSDQLLNAVRPARNAPIDEGLANAALAAMHAIAPRDEIEAMLASQMVATHAAAMDMMGQTHRAEHRHTLQDNGNLAVKLLRTYSAQLEALQRYRGKGQQKVTVEHVHVHKGGQAIVGNVEARTQGGGATSKTEGRPHAKQLAHAPEPTLSCPDPEREAVSVSRSKR